MEKPKTLVTGASGLSGAIIIQEFIKQNLPVRALVRNRQKVKHFEQYPNVDIYEGDMFDAASLKDAFAGIEKVLMISSSDSKMVETQRYFIDCVKEAGVPHLIKYSGADSGVGFNARNFVSQDAHEQVEDYLVDSGLKWTIIRPSQFMQFYLPKKPTGVNLEKNALLLPINKGEAFSCGYRRRGESMCSGSNRRRP
jgi:uncharacterized protein YbjT (DUF2867 family)